MNKIIIATVITLLTAGGIFWLFMNHPQPQRQMKEDLDPVVGPVYGPDGEEIEPIPLYTP